MSRWGILVALGITATAGARTNVVDGVAAYVNDQVITVSDVLRTLGPLAEQYQRQYVGAKLTAKLQDAYEETLQALIDRRLIVEAFERDPKTDHGRVERQVEQDLNELIRQRFGGDRERLRKALEQEHQTLEDFRRRLREQLIGQFMFAREVDRRVLISPAEIRRAYEAAPEKYRLPERLHLRVIVIRGGQDEEQRQARKRRAEEVREQLLGGADFAELARKFSEDSKAAVGGDWGWLQPGELQPALRQELEKLEIGGLSGVVAWGNDFYIMRVEERQLARIPSFDEVRRNIERELRQKEAKRLYDAWIDRLRRKAYIHVVKSALP